MKCARAGCTRSAEVVVEVLGDGQQFICLACFHTLSERGRVVTEGFEGNAEVDDPAPAHTPEAGEEADA